MQLPAQDFQQLRRYTVSYAMANGHGKSLVAIRSFVINGAKYLMLVDPKTLNTTIAPAQDYECSKLAFGNVQAIFKNSTYVKSMELALVTARQLQNAGIDHAIPNEKGIALTIDLCPSHKPLDQLIFRSLINEFKKIQKPVPLAISISGKWMMAHQSDLDWLKSLVSSGDLDITWINHSFNHEVNSLPFTANFLLSKDTNLSLEILENEKLMLKNGIIPSVFFRFPGLVSDQEIVARIVAYGLIPVGSDAWLAKGEQPHAGSIVLIHGNGNEEIGVRDFIRLLQQKKIDIKRKQWLLFDLRSGLENSFKR